MTIKKESSEIVNRIYAAIKSSDLEEIIMVHTMRIDQRNENEKSDILSELTKKGESGSVTMNDILRIFKDHGVDPQLPF